MSMENVKNELNKITEKTHEDLSALRIGRASAMMVENVLVDYYGTKTPLKQIANISVPDARLIVIEPWAKENLKDIISGINAANLGVNPVSDGVAIKIAFPPMSEEERKKTVKLLSQRVEKAKVSVRLLRDKEREKIKEQEKNKEIGKDEKFRLEKELQKLIDQASGDIEKIAEEKERDIMTV